VTEFYLSTERLCVSFGATQALGGVDVSFGAGVNGVLGPNGAGKTTLLRVLIGELRPTSGRVLVNGSSIGGGKTLRNYQNAIGYLPQDPNWFEGFSARQFCDYMAGLRGISGSKRKLAVVEALRQVDMHDKGEVRLKSLSGGQRRRVFIAQALVHDPSVLILDEPTAGLDPVQRIQLRELIARLGRTRTVVMSTHLVEDVAHIASNVVILADGSVKWVGTPEELAAQATATTDSASVFERGFLAVVREESQR
jgi:ABC-2 type transport system ATP-binding protein